MNCYDLNATWYQTRQNGDVVILSAAKDLSCLGRECSLGKRQERCFASLSMTALGRPGFFRLLLVIP